MRGALVAFVLFACLVVAGCGGGGTASQTSNGCESVKKPPARKAEKMVPPTTQLDSSKTYSLNVRTSCGTFVIRLDTRLAPQTTASLVKLARSGYFDDTIFHRIVPGFVIQGGDPTQTGAGGPGYWLLDRPPANARYTKGTVAMAKTPDDPAGLAGSQFFVVTAGDSGLSPDYALVGKVTSGMDVVTRIGKLGSASGQPKQTVVIEKITPVVHL
jgi:peptidyl-prolyl cis-trans isomerase B (cyclophilin B)